MNTVKLVNAKSELDAFFKDLFDKTDDRIMAAARHGVSEAINSIKERTKQNVSSSWFNGVTSAGRTLRGRTYTRPLIEGVQAYMWQKTATGFVHIMGTPRYDDGTWRLRMFEGGTRQRRSKKGNNYGSLKPALFFANAITSAEPNAVSMIQSSIQSAIDEINHSNK